MSDATTAFLQFVWHYLGLLGTWLGHEPEIAVFLSIGIGFYIGSRKIGPIQLGGVCGTLMIALVLGQSGIVVPPEVKNVFFALFIFALGYAGGPQFFGSLNAKGLRLGIFSVIEVGFVLLIAWLAMRIFSLDGGTTAGLVAGAATESAVIGTASDAISRLPFTPEYIRTLQANVVTAYSVTYIFGLVTIVLFTSQIIPLILRKNVQDEADKLWKSLGSNTLADTQDTENALPERIGRSFIVTVGAKKEVGHINRLMGKSAFIESIYRRKKPLEVTDSTVLRSGDTVLVFGQRDAVMLASAVLGEECGKPGALNMALDTEKYIVSRKGGAGLTLGELANRIQDEELNRHVHLVSVMRNKHAMPLVPQLTLQAGDQLQLLGSAETIHQAGRFIGHPLVSNNKTNFVYIGLGLILGILIGQISIPLKGIDLSLGTGGGALLTGLIFGWFQTRSPRIPATPPASLELMKDIGLAAFVACIGLSAGKQAFLLVRQYGPILPLAGVSIALTPAIISFLVGHFLLKLELPVLLGGIAGQQCSTPALSAVQAAAGNTTPLMGYTITYAISNVLLPLLGPIIVGIGFA